MKKTRIGLSDDEVRIIVLSLVELWNALIQEPAFTTTEEIDKLFERVGL